MCRVVESCFGQDLAPNYRAEIRRFEEFYRMLDINVTPKVHCVSVHIEHFLALKGEVAGLGAYSEQVSNNKIYYSNN